MDTQVSRQTWPSQRCLGPSIPFHQSERTAGGPTLLDLTLAGRYYIVLHVASFRDSRPQNATFLHDGGVDWDMGCGLAGTGNVAHLGDMAIASAA